MANYVVTTRNKNGSLEERAYTANDRAELFKKLAADGVAAVSVREGVVKKTSSRENLALSRGALAGILVVLLAAVVFYFVFSFKTNENAVKDKGKTTEISNIKSALQSGKKVQTAKREERDAGLTKVVAKSREERKATVSDNEHEVTNAVPEKDEKKKDNRLFKNPMDQLLAMVAPQNVGDGVPPLPIVDNMKFSPEDERKILERLAADDKDSDAILERKELVQSMRDEYQELKKRGWTFIDYVKALEANANLDTEIKEESIKIHETVFNDSTISDEEYLKTLEKINKVLEERGIAPIKPPEDEDESTVPAKKVSQSDK